MNGCTLVVGYLQFEIMLIGLKKGLSQELKSLGDSSLLCSMYTSKE